MIQKHEYVVLLCLVNIGELCDDVEGYEQKDMVVYSAVCLRPYEYSSGY